MDDSVKQLVRDVIYSMCFPCARRIIPFQYFVVTSDSQKSSKSYWVTEYLKEKRVREAVPAVPSGCGICFGLLEKYSQTEYLTELADQVNNYGIQFKDFRISLTTPNVSVLREKFIRLLLDNIPLEELPTKLYNPKCLSIKADWKILTFCPLEVIIKKPYNHQGLFDVILKYTLEDGLEADDKLLATRSDPFFQVKPKRLSKKCRDQKEIQETGFTTQNVEQIIKENNLEKLKTFYQLPFKRLIMKPDLECFHDSIFLAGRYLKFSRMLSQTRWTVEGERSYKINSIEEILGEVLLPAVGSSELLLSASGREDIDVKCLGKGRPFVLEFLRPKCTSFTQEELNNYQKVINGSTSEMEIRDLQYITRDQTKNMREGEMDKTKCYSALCYCYSKIDAHDIDKLNSLSEVKTFQKTPIRVLHRRTVMTRPRIISEIQTELIDEHHFRIRMKTQAGTYVKEFVHGDLGRTEPSVCTILNKECDILELDVEAVNLDFPPEINHDNETPLLATAE